MFFINKHNYSYHGNISLQLYIFIYFIQDSSLQFLLQKCKYFYVLDLKIQDLQKSSKIFCFI